MHTWRHPLYVVLFHSPSLVVDVECVVDEGSVSLVQPYSVIQCFQPFPMSPHLSLPIPSYTWLNSKPHAVLLLLALRCSVTHSPPHPFIPSHTVPPSYRVACVAGNRVGIHHRNIHSFYKLFLFSMQSHLLLSIDLSFINHMWFFFFTYFTCRQFFLLWSQLCSVPSVA